jgi:hypothetical protein
MIARALQFAAKHYLNYSAIKLAYFLGALSGIIFETILVSLVLAGYDLTRLVP